MIKVTLRPVTEICKSVNMKAYLPYYEIDYDKIVSIWISEFPKVEKIRINPRNQSEGEDKFSHVWGRVYYFDKHGPDYPTPDFLPYWIILKSGLVYSTNSGDVAYHIWKEYPITAAAEDFETLLTIAYL